MLLLLLAGAGTAAPPATGLGRTVVDLSQPFTVWAEGTRPYDAVVDTAAPYAVEMQHTRPYETTIDFEGS